MQLQTNGGGADGVGPIGVANGRRKWASWLLDKHAGSLGRPACQDICCKKAILCLQRHEKPLFVSISR